MADEQPTVAGSTLALAVQTPDAGPPAALDDPARWTRELRVLARNGFTEVDVVDGWLRFPELSDAGRQDLGTALSDAGVRAAGLNISRCSLVDPHHGERNLEYTLAAVDTAAALGVPLLCLGFHPVLDERYAQGWFWELPQPADDRSDATWTLAADRLRAVCGHAAGAGVRISIELYEDSLVCTAADIDRILGLVGADNLGINPDLGNTYRSATPLREPWLTTLRGAIPVMNLWHLKNYTRHSRSPDGPFVIAATALGEGGIDYRLAVREVLAAGFRGPMVVEHYGGDAVWLQRRGREYLQRLLDDVGVDS